MGDVPVTLVTSTLVTSDHVWLETEEGELPRLYLTNLSTELSMASHTCNPTLLETESRKFKTSLGYTV